MTTWTTISRPVTGYDFPADDLNGYVVIGYVSNGYILPSNIWSEVAHASTSWA